MLEAKEIECKFLDSMVAITQSFKQVHWQKIEPLGKGVVDGNVMDVFRINDEFEIWVDICKTDVEIHDGGLRIKAPTIFYLKRQK